MSNGEESVPASPITGAPAEVEPEEPPEEQVKEQVKEAIEEIQDVVTGSIAPPGTPSLSND